MKVFEIGTGYTSIPARMGAATEIVVAELTTSMMKIGEDVTIIDIKINIGCLLNCRLRKCICLSFLVQQTQN